MKKVILAVVIFATIGLTNSFGQTEMTKMKENATISMASFGVRGNCGMCQKTIEKAAKSVNGVSEANWNKETKSIMISYDNTKTTLMEVHKAIAVSGYDTEKMSANPEAYNNLAGCCKYDHEMEMNQKEETKTEHQH